MDLPEVWHTAYTEVLTGQVERMLPGTQEDWTVTRLMSAFNLDARVAYVVKASLAYAASDRTDVLVTLEDGPTELKMIVADWPELDPQARERVLEVIRQGGIHVHHYHTHVCPHLPTASRHDHALWLLAHSAGQRHEHQ